MPSRIARANMIFVCLMILAAALLAAIVLIDRKAGLNYTYTFDDAKDLAIGAPVKMRGTQIGEVTGVRLADQRDAGVQIDVRVYAEHRNRINAAPDSTARIKKDSMVLGNAYVDVINRGDGSSGAMASGTVVEGLDGWTEEKLWVAKDKMSSGYAKALSMGAEGIDRVEEWAKSEDGQKLKTQVNDFLGSLEEASATKAQQARSKFGEALEKGTKLLNDMRAQAEGAANSDTADDLQKSLEELLKQAENLDDQTRERVEALLKEAKEKTSETMEKLPDLKETGS